MSLCTRTIRSSQSGELSFGLSLRNSLLLQPSACLVSESFTEQGTVQCIWKRAREDLQQPSQAAKLFDEQILELIENRGIRSNIEVLASFLRLWVHRKRGVLVV